MDILLQVFDVVLWLPQFASSVLCHIILPFERLQARFRLSPAENGGNMPRMLPLAPGLLIIARLQEEK
jgi:hypothetical protein